MKTIDHDNGAKIVIKQPAGVTWHWTYDVLDDDDNAYDFTGHSAKLQVRKTARGADSLLIELNSTDGSIVLSAGSMVFRKEVADTEDLEVGTHSFALEVTDASGNTDRWVSGVFVINSDGVK